MEAPRTLKERVQLVDDDRLQAAKQVRCLRRPPKQQRLDRFRRDQGDALGPI